jgi:hypothetical protein
LFSGFTSAKNFSSIQNEGSNAFSDVIFESSFLVFPVQVSNQDEAGRQAKKRDSRIDANYSETVLAAS